MGQSRINTVESDFLADPARWSGYSEVDEVLAITSTDQTQNAAWVSPSASIISENSDLSKYFSYTLNPGSVTYVGTIPILVEAMGIITAEAQSAGAHVRLKWAKNNTPEVDPQRYIQDKILNANASVQLSVMRNFKLEYGDYLDFFMGADILGNITLKKSEWKVGTKALILE